MRWTHLLYNVESVPSSSKEKEQLLRGIVAKRYVSGICLFDRLFTVSHNNLKTQYNTLGVYTILDKTLGLNTFTPFCFPKGMHFLISVGLLQGIGENSPIRTIRIRSNKKTYETTLRYLAYKGEFLKSYEAGLLGLGPERDEFKHMFIKIHRRDMGLKTALTWENFIDSASVTNVSVFDLFRLKIPFKKYVEALEFAAIYKERFGTKEESLLND